MEGKLIKTGLNYDLITKDKDGEEIWLATSSDYKLKKLAPLKNPLTNELIQINKLSLKNCQAIANGYDLEEISSSLRKEFEIKYNTGKGIPVKGGGYIIRGLDYQVGVIDGFQKALEILGDKKFSEEDMRVAYDDGMSNIDSNGDLIDTLDDDFNDTIQSLQQTEWDVSFNPDEKDSEGCLILKRKI